MADNFIRYIENLSNTLASIGRVAQSDANRRHLGWMNGKSIWEGDDIKAAKPFDLVRLNGTETVIVPLPPPTKRFHAVEGSDTGHCCFEASVVERVKTGRYISDERTVAECFDVASAEMIADALNQRKVRS